jgi:hypothetical protein
MEADDLPCSRNARSQTPLVGRAQWKIIQPPSLKRERVSLEGAIDRNVSLDACNTERPHLPPLHRFSIGLCIHKSTCNRKVLE